MARNPKEEDELRNFLAHRQYPQAPKFKLLPKSTARMQHDLARNLLIGFLVLIVVVIVAVYLFDAKFCSGNTGISRCGNNFININSVVETLLNFGTPFIGIIIGFFFSEKFKGGKDNDE